MKPLCSALASIFLMVGAGIGDASAQQEGRTYSIGWLTLGQPGQAPLPYENWTGLGAAFRETLRTAGYAVGKNLIVHVRHAHGDVAGLTAEAEALVAAGVDVIVTSGTQTTVPAMQATKRIPIVFWGVGDPVEIALAAM